MRSAGELAHYRRFLQADPPPGEDLVLVLGNCQAESVRLLLDPVDERTVRVPPVFELTTQDVGSLRTLLGRASAVVTQPVRDDYRGLPLGTRQIASWVGQRCPVITFPIVRYAGLHPFHVVVHSANDGSRPLPQPPLVPYHDLRVVAAATGGLARTEPSVDAVRAVGQASLDELVRREALLDVAVSDTLVHPGAEHMRTVNHPGNPVLMALARAVAAALGWAAPAEPGRRLLDGVRAPVEPVVADAWGLEAGTAKQAWVIDGRQVPAAEIRASHRRWYDAHPDVARQVWARHGGTASLLGLV